MVLPFCVYVLPGRKEYHLYHGYSVNLGKRLQGYNPEGTKRISKHMPFHVVYCEFFLTKQDAIRRESYFKTSQGKQMLKLILRDAHRKLEYTDRR
jgi:putative endonuclease